MLTDIGHEATSLRYTRFLKADYKPVMNPGLLSKSCCLQENLSQKPGLGSLELTNGAL